MKNTLKGYLIGVLSTVMLLGCVAYAASNTKTIEILYNNIKIYVDGVKINPKDANGKTVEPFIYNGTTYLPVRAVGEAIGKTVTWDGATQSVYLGEKSGQKNYLTTVCPAYEFDKSNYKECTTANGESFYMGGKQYTNGFYASASTDLQNNSNAAYYNLNSKYKKLSFIAGAIDNKLIDEAKIRIYADGNLIKTIDISSDTLPKEYSVSLNYALQLKIEMVSSRKGYNIGKLGMANIVLE